MRLYPRYTVERTTDESAFQVMDQVEHRVIDNVVGLTKAYKLATKLEALVCIECGVQPRTGGTAFCIYCYVERKL